MQTLAPSGLIGLHLIGIILWMGGLFQLARHLGQHAELDADAEAARSSFAEWERKTYYFVALPGLVLTLGTGLYALTTIGWGAYLSVEGPYGSTFHMKLLLVAVLLGADQFVRYKMEHLHADGEASRGPFMAVHGVVALIFILLIMMMTTRFLA